MSTMFCALLFSYHDLTWPLGLGVIGVCLVSGRLFATVLADRLQNMLGLFKDEEGP
jgi:hypothetical protein